LSYTFRYTLFGIGFGLCFPIFALLLDVWVFKSLLPNWNNVFLVHQLNPLHYIIDTAPIFLGLAFGIAGKYLDQLYKVNISLEKTIDERTKELKIKNLELFSSDLELRESQQKLQAILDSTSEANFFVSLHSEIISFNKTAENLVRFFYNRGIQVGDNFDTYLMPENKEDFRRIFGQALSGNVSIEEIEIFFPNSARLWLNIEFYPVYDYHQQIIGISINAADITQRKKAELHLAAQNRELRNIAWLHSHEIRRIVANVIGLISLIDSTDLSLENLEVLQHLDNSARELDEAIHKIVKTVNELEYLGFA
jgi:PAS domain S-box-containing protein